MATMNIKIYKGTVFVLPLSLKQTGGCVPLDLSDAIITGNVGDGSPTIPFKIRDVDLANGSFEVRLPEATINTLDFTDNRGRYQIIVDLGQSPQVKKVILEGNVQIVEAV